MGLRRRSSDKITIVPYNPAWPAQFEQIAAPLAAALGALAIRIDHIGSTAVPGLAAKDRIDIQLTLGRA
ncbi:MAG: GrpB family protein, partial [Cyanobacteria bacterium SZAS LIN-2]|nr:GrpB family protein [Cyanobacteria bacterium SZAS LIN-2]